MLARPRRRRQNSSQQRRSSAVSARPREQVGPALERAAQRLRPPPPGDPGVVAASAAPRAPPSPGTRPAGCTAGTRAGRRRTTRRRADVVVAHDARDEPGRPPRSPRAPPPRRRRARSRRPTARRRTGGRRPAGRRPRSGRTAARSPSPAASSRGVRLVEAAARRPTAGAAGAAARAASTAAKSGSGAITMPAPPPNGVSSTLRWRSVGVLAQVVHPHVERARRSRARPSSDAPSGPVEVLGEDREDVDAHGILRARAGRRAGRSTTTPSRVLDHEHHRHQRAAVEHQQVVRGVRLDARRPGPSACPARSTTSAPISSCTQSSSSSSSTSSASGSRGEHRRPGAPRPRCGRRRPSKLHEPPALVRARRRDDELTVAGVEHARRARRARAGCS